MIHGIPEHRQLDAETAMKVFEWDWIEHTDWKDMPGRGLVCIGGNRMKFPGGCPHVNEILPLYFSNMTEAWKVIQKAHGWIFSRRKSFMAQLQILVSNRLIANGSLTHSGASGADTIHTGNDPLIAWPDVLWFVTPPDICLAGIHVVDSLREKERK